MTCPSCMFSGDVCKKQGVSKSEQRSEQNGSRYQTMNQKFLVINCDENDVDVLCQYLGGRQVVMCDSLDDVSRFLPSERMAALVTPAGGVEEACTVEAGDQSAANGQRNELEQLVERIVEQNNGHSRTLAARVDLLEQKIIEHSLQRNRQHRKETAAELGISRVTLYNKMKKFGLLD